MPANGGWDLTLILLMWTIWRAPTNASKWRMGFNSAYKGLRESKRKTIIFTRNLPELLFETLFKVWNSTAVNVQRNLTLRNSAFYPRSVLMYHIKILNSLPPPPLPLKIKLEKPKFKVALRECIIDHAFYFNPPVKSPSVFKISCIAKNNKKW